jgi:hypothetical protein
MIYSSVGWAANHLEVDTDYDPDKPTTTNIMHRGRTHPPPPPHTHTHFWRWSLRDHNNKCYGFYQEYEELFYMILCVISRETEKACVS